MYFSAPSVASLVATSVVLYFFVIKHRLLFSYYHGECIAVRTGVNTSSVDALTGLFIRFFNVIRPTGTVLAMVILWCGAVWQYIKSANQIDVQYDIFEGGLAFIFGTVPITFLLFVIFLWALLSREERK